MVHADSGVLIAVFCLFLSCLGSREMRKIIVEGAEFLASGGVDVNEKQEGVDQMIICDFVG